MVGSNRMEALSPFANFLIESTDAVPGIISDLSSLLVFVNPAIFSSSDRNQLIGPDSTKNPSIIIPSSSIAEPLCCDGEVSELRRETAFSNSFNFESNPSSESLSADSNKDRIDSASALLI